MRQYVRVFPRNCRKNDVADGTVTDNLRPVTVPAGHVFVISDNRGNARDSRLDGPLDEDRIIGTVAFVGFPLDHILFGATLVLGVALLVVAITARRTRGPV